MLIHAYKRKEATPVETGNAVIEFNVNANGEVVADVVEEADIAVLLANAGRERSSGPDTFVTPPALPGPRPGRLGHT